MGGHRSVFTTTNLNSFQDTKGAPCGMDSKGQSDRRSKMRGHHFSIGGDPRTTNYVTQNASTLKNFSRASTAQKQRSDSAGTNIRSSHFQFGRESAPMVSVQKSDFNQTAIIGKPDKLPFDFMRTNFELGRNYPAAITTTHLDFTSNSDVKQEGINKAQSKGLRQTHFVLGKHPYAYVGGNLNGEYGKGHKEAEKTDFNRSLQFSHFNVGDPKQASKFFNSQYRVDHEEREIKGPLTTEPGKNSFRSSIQMNGRQRSMPANSQNTATYLEQNMEAAKKDMLFEKFLRANHFSIGHKPKADPDHYKSI